MRERTNIFLQHTCSYTREGIKSLLAELEDITPTNLIAEEKKLQPSLNRLMHKPDADIFILGLQSNGNNASEILSFIIKTVASFFPKARVIIMTELNSLGKLKDYLLGLNNVYAVLDNGITLKEMHLRLTEILTLPKSVQPCPFQSPVTPLTHQELSVLGFLLKGKSANEVAYKLRIHCKTVSSHKQSALHKLGIHSLHGLLTSGNNREMMYQLLHYQRKRTPCTVCRISDTFDKVVPTK
ncbi:LuxR C-terminal-related transcriptional regulator [Serratia sp. J2]|uniref:helix-turn-helix transcriptional regulator n=1 Tax=Serratia sp. J2 TaxID=3386551 RepID=UPI003916D1AE